MRRRGKKQNGRPDPRCGHLFYPRTRVDGRYSASHHQFAICETIFMRKRIPGRRRPRN
jgi:hypothetical protein